MIELLKVLREKNLKIATAESCTGGLLSKMITDFSGSSEVFECGICSYSNDIKIKLLGVSSETLMEYGAVSSQVAQQMAKGVAKLAGADIGVGITGIAGPLGGTSQKKVGLVYISVFSKNGFYTIENMFDGSRDNVRQSSVKKAIEITKKFLKNMKDD